MADESKPKPPPPSLSKPKPPSQPLPDPPTDAPPPDLATTPKPPGEPEIKGPPGPPPEEKKTIQGSDPELDPTLAPGPKGSLAPLKSRIIAGLIDAVVAYGLSFMLVAILPNALDFLGYVVAAAYWIVRDSLEPLNGQSLGKSAMKIKAVKADGGSLVNDWQNAVIRNVLLIIPFGGLVELIVLMVRNDKPEKGKRLGDDWAKTKVVVA